MLGIVSKFQFNFKYLQIESFIASICGHTGVAKELLDRGAHIGAMDNDMNTPLILGIQKNLNSKLIYNYNINILLIYTTFIVSICKKDVSKVVKELIDRGANILAKNKLGLDPLSACNYGSQLFIKTIYVFLQSCIFLQR